MDKIIEYHTLTCLFDELDQIKVNLENLTQRLHEAMENSISYNADGLRDKNIASYVASIKSKNLSPMKVLLPHFQDQRSDLELSIILNTEYEGD
jgi:hypothetical protein